MSGLTLETGALIALERRDVRAVALLAALIRKGGPLRYRRPWWWRGQRGPIALLLEAFDVESLSNELAHVAGIALARAGRGPSATDAVVIASAAQRGDVVLTGDLEDLTALQAEVFPGVRLLRV